MAAFSYKAMTKDGRRVDGTVQATDRRGALAAVRKLGHTPLSVSEAGGAAAAKKRKGAGGGAESIWNMKIGGHADTMTQMEVLLFTSELADLLDAYRAAPESTGLFAGPLIAGNSATGIGRTIADRSAK